MNSLKEKLLKEAIPDTEWLKEAQWRQDNYFWLKTSFQIAIQIGSVLKQKEMTQKELAEKMACSPQFISTLLKGSENLTLETICKIEKVLEIKLITVVSVETASDYISEYEPVLNLPKSKKYANDNQEYKQNYQTPSLDEYKNEYKMAA
jgi:transcriptional regulator with XRE-family HTH domain